MSIYRRTHEICEEVFPSNVLSRIKSFPIPNDASLQSVYMAVKVRFDKLAMQ
jgi:hypothetical protein